MREVPHLLMTLGRQSLWALSAVVVILLQLSCSSFSGFEKFQGPDSYGSDSTDTQNYDLMLPEFRGNAPAPSPRSGGGPIGEGPFVLEWPVDAAHLTQKYRPPRNRKHQGIDLAGRMNTPILAAHDGIVVYAGRGFKGYGRMILVEYNHIWATLYAHLNRYKVKTGTWVKRGQLIGLMGRSGRVSGVHLHFELLKERQPIDPLSMLRLKGEIAQLDPLTYTLARLQLAMQPMRTDN